jgi:hypothetical protein
MQPPFMMYRPYGTGARAVMVHGIRDQGATLLCAYETKASPDGLIAWGLAKHLIPRDDLHWTRADATAEARRRRDDARARSTAGPPAGADVSQLAAGA